MVFRIKGHMNKVSIHMWCDVRLKSFTLPWVIILLFAGAGRLFAQQPVASFTVSASQGCAPLNVLFTNTSQNAVSYVWNFGNGNSSSQVNPSNVFTNAGVFNVTLTATAANGTTSTVSQQISAIGKPVAGFNVLQQYGCQGSGPITFQNTSSAYDSCVWDFGDGTTSTLVNPQHIYSISGTFNVTLVVFNKALGCSDVHVKNSIVTVYPKPSAVISVNDTVTCDPLFSFQFNAILSNTVSQTWLFGDGTSSSQANPVKVYNDTGYFNVALVLTSSNGCMDTIRRNRMLRIKYNPLPLVNISDDTGCMPHYLSMISTYYTNATYLWDLGNGITRNSSAVYYTYPDSGIFPVNLNVTYTSGCQRNLTVGPIVVAERPSFVYFMSNYTGCAPHAVTFLNYSSSKPYTWLWDFGDGDTSTAVAPVHVYTQQGNFQVSLTATNANGCTYGYPLSQRVKINAPIAQFNTDISMGCPPLTVNFNNTSTHAISYYWDFGDGSTSTAQHPAHTYTNIGTYTVRLIASDTSSCSDTLVMTNLIQVAPTAANYVTPPPISACAPHAVNFADASGASAYLWTFGDGDSSTSANPYHVYQTPGVYTVSLTTWMPNGGCEIHIPDFQTFIIDGLNPGFTYTVSPCPPYVVNFTDTTNGAVSWSWNFGDGGTSNAQNPSHTYSDPGNYNVTLTATSSGGCPTQLQMNGGVVINGLGAQATVFCNDTTPPFSVQFYANSSNATWWLWDFGDGTTSSQENPSHLYTGAGPFTVRLTVGNDSCQYTYVYPPVNFGGGMSNPGAIGGGGPLVTPRVYHCAPYSVSFILPDPSATSWLWDFGDGTTSMARSPVHAYSDSGAFVPLLYLANSHGGFDTLVFSDTIFVVEPVRDFILNTVNTCQGVSVNTSLNEPVSSLIWSFGNGVIFNTSSASHMYPNINASYQISLDVTDTNGCSSFVVKSFMINSNSPLSFSQRRACAGDSILFSPGNVNYTSYLWIFDDGTTSQSRNPLHAYQDSGLFQVSLEVTDTNGCKQTFLATHKIEVFDPVASFTQNLPLSNCTNLFIQFNNTSSGSNSWLWEFGNGNVSSQFSPGYTFSAPGYYDITLIARNSVCADTVTVPNAVYVSRLVPAFNYTINSACVPAVATFSDLSTDANTWHWDFGDGNTSNLQNPVHTYTKNPLDSVVLTVTDVNGCVKSVTMPAPSLTYADFSTTGAQGCAPLQVAFTDSSSNVISRMWYFGDGDSSSAVSPFHTYTADGFYDVMLIVTSVNGCSDTLLLDSLIEVDTPVASFSADSLIGCAPLFLNFTDGSTNAVAWFWDFGNGTTSGNQNPSLIYAQPGTYNVSLMASNKFGCTDTLTYDSLIVVRGATPLFSLQYNQGCAPALVNFTNLSLNAVSYEWHFGDGTTDTTANPVHVYQDSGSFTVSLYAVDSSGCTSVYTYPYAIDIGNSPTGNFAVDHLMGCAPFTIAINDSGTVADSVVWIMGDGTLRSGSNPFHTYTSPGSYLIKMVLINGGCVDTVNYSDSIIVIDMPRVYFSGNNLTGCLPLNASFQDSSAGLSNPVYQWDFGDGIGSGLVNPAHIYTAPGTYTVTLWITNNGLCADSMSLTDMVTVFDPSPPAAVDIRLVTAADSQKVILRWPANNESDIDYYIVYRLNSNTGQYDSLSLLPDSPGSTLYEFVDMAVNTNSASYTYKVIAVDRCGSRIHTDQALAFRTILLDAVPGNKTVNLAWNTYINCEIQGYEIWRAEDVGMPWALIAAVDTAFNSYKDSTAICPFSYLYQVKAIDVCGYSANESTSNLVQARPESDIHLQSSDIVRSTVVDDNYILTEWSPPAILPQSVERYDIFRSTDNVNYQLIASVPRNVFEYEDRNVLVDTLSYIYKVLPQNECRVQPLEGVHGNSILLNLIDLDVKRILKWIPYEHWKTGIDYYVIQKMNQYGQWEEIERVPSGITNWEEE